ncbi:Acetyl-coenzyme A synthetase, partial [Caligus rogercresseyi]
MVVACWPVLALGLFTPSSLEATAPTPWPIGFATGEQRFSSLRMGSTEGKNLSISLMWPIKPWRKHRLYM